MREEAPASGVPEDPRQPEEPQGSLAVLALLSLLVGAISGLIGAVFRLTLAQGDRCRDAILAWAHGWGLLGLLLILVGSAVATGLAAWLVRRHSPEAAGSGIPHVEAVLTGESPPASWSLLPVKFVGGFLAIGTGLALGREGPSVQMGASLAHLVGTIWHLPWSDSKVLLAAGAGAGLATAFSAPIAGAVFVLEELVRRFDTRITIATLGASAGAIAVARVLLGNAPDFQVAPLSFPGYGTLPVYLVLGAIAGFLGIAYNQTLLGTLAAVARLHTWPIELRAALIGAAVGLLAWYAPGLIGGGDAITQQTLAGSEVPVTVALVFILRFGLGALSYAAGTPGGLFAPMLVLGSQIGLLFGSVCHAWFPSLAPHPSAFAIVGMAAFFTAVVRAPVTGIILVGEMTNSFVLLLPMLGACFAAMLVPTLLGNAPIYDTLRQRTLRE